MQQIFIECLLYARKHSKYFDTTLEKAEKKILAHSHDVLRVLIWLAVNFYNLGKWMKILGVVGWFEQLIFIADVDTQTQTSF